MQSLRMKRIVQIYEVFKLTICNFKVVLRSYTVLETFLSLLIAMLRLIIRY